MIELPLDTTEENYSISVTLDPGESYTFRFLWNARANLWFFDLKRDADEKILLSQLAVTSHSALINQFVGFQSEDENAFPKGQLIVYDTEQTYDKDPGLGELGNRFKILYFDENESVNEIGLDPRG